MDTLRLIGLFLTFAGFFAAICGGSWDMANGLDGTFWCMIAGLIFAALGGGCLFITGDWA